MIIRNFTSEDYPAIAGIHNRQEIAWPERPRTPEGWANSDRNRGPQSRYQRWVAVEDGRVVGFASYSQSPWDYPPQSFYVNVEVLPEYQRRGIGAALYVQVMDGIQAFHPPALRADAFANLPQGFAFLQKRGFYEAFRETPVSLDVNAFDPAPYAGLEAKLADEGIIIKTLREMEADPDRDRKLYNLYWQANDDVPHEGELSEHPAFDEWIGWGLRDPSILPDAYFIAIKGDNYIGLRELSGYTDQDSLLGGLLGVRRENRQRGVGLALQLRGISYAKAHGYRLLKTCTAIQNAPMQALFNKLGYARSPEWQQCQKDIGS